MRISDWSSDVCSSDLLYPVPRRPAVDGAKHVAIARPCIENIERPARRAGNRAFQPVERRPMGERQPVDERQMPQALPEVLIAGLFREIGRPSCRERWLRYV